MGEIGQGQIGLNNYADGNVVNQRLDKTGAQVVVQGKGRWYEANSRNTVFYGSNGATPAVTTVAFATTYTGLVLINPAGSGKYLSILRVGWSLLVVQPAVATVGLMTGFSAAGTTTFSAAASSASPALIGAGTTAVGKCALSATLVGTPTLHSVFGSALTGAVTTIPTQQNIVDIEGACILQPGAYAAIYTSTVSGAASLAASFLWEEVPV